MGLVRSEVVISQVFAGTPGEYVYTLPGGAPTPGNLLVIGMAHEVRQLSSVGGTNMTFTINGAQQAGLSGWLSQWKCIVGASPGTTVTLTLSGGSGVAPYFFFMEFDGADADQSGSTANGSTPTATQTHDSGSVTPPTADNIVVASMYRDPGGTWTPDASFTMLTTGANEYAVGYLVQTAATAQVNNVTVDTNRDSGMLIGAFAGSGGAPPPDAFVKVLLRAA